MFLREDEEVKRGGGGRRREDKEVRRGRGLPSPNHVTPDSSSE
jgi:hypothetical protein